MPRLFTPREAAQVLGIGYATLKQWIYRQKISTVKTGLVVITAYPKKHSSIDTCIGPTRRGDVRTRRSNFSTHSVGRNQLVGRITDLRFDGLLAQVTLSIGGQRIISIITSEAALEMRLELGQTVAALIKSTEVMIIRQ